MSVTGHRGHGTRDRGITQDHDRGADIKADQMRGSGETQHTLREPRHEDIYCGCHLSVGVVTVLHTHDLFRKQKK